MVSIEDFYRDAQKEWHRLDLPLCRIEFASTLNMVDLYFARGGRVADIGGGPGRYMLELLRRGYRVTLFDLSPENVAFAKAKAAEAGLAPDGMLVGDARDLSQLKEQRFDGVLALGPLYHLTERRERVAFLRAVKAMLSPVGIVIAAYLNPWGIARSLLRDAPKWFEQRANLPVLLTGAAFGGPRACSGFTECSWSTPDDARAEISEAGLIVLEEVGAEGFAAGLRTELETIASSHPLAFEQIVSFGVQTSRLPQYRRATDHLLLVARA